MTEKATTRDSYDDIECDYATEARCRDSCWTSDCLRQDNTSDVNDHDFERTAGCLVTHPVSIGTQTKRPKLEAQSRLLLVYYYITKLIPMSVSKNKKRLEQNLYTRQIGLAFHLYIYYEGMQKMK